MALTVCGQHLAASRACGGPFLPAWSPGEVDVPACGTEPVDVRVPPSAGHSLLSVNLVVRNLLNSICTVATSSGLLAPPWPTEALIEIVMSQLPNPVTRHVRASQSRRGWFQCPTRPWMLPSWSGHSVVRSCAAPCPRRREAGSDDRDRPSRACRRTACERTPAGFRHREAATRRRGRVPTSFST